MKIVEAKFESEKAEKENQERLDKLYQEWTYKFRTDYMYDMSMMNSCLEVGKDVYNQR